MKILIACEESQIVCSAFRQRNLEAYSCDLLPSSGNYPQYHIQDNVLNHLNKDWTLIIAHPPCTFLTVTGNKWMKPEFSERFPNRQKERSEAIDFFMTIAQTNCNHIAIENPVGIISTHWRKPNQYIQPYYFGDPHPKKTGLWLKNLPLLKPTNPVEPNYHIYKNGRKDSIWHMETLKLPKEERTKMRSKTFEGIAQAMAQQWGDFLIKLYEQ